MIGEIMRRSALGERRDIPQTGDGLIVLLSGAMRMSHVIHGAPDLRVGNQKTSDARQERETLRRAATGKSSSAQGGIKSWKAGGPLPAPH